MTHNPQRDRERMVYAEAALTEALTLLAALHEWRHDPIRDSDTYDHMDDAVIAFLRTHHPDYQGDA